MHIHGYLMGILMSLSEVMIHLALMSLFQWVCLYFMYILMKIVMKPPRAPPFLMGTVLLCNGTASEIGNAIHQELTASRYTDMKCEVRCNPSESTVCVLSFY